MTLDVRTVFLSDCHLGSRATDARALSQFLKYTRCQRIYLVGDIIDMWRLRQRWYWPGEHNNVVRRLLNHTKHGTDVVLIPGNHDEAARQFFDSDFGGVRVVPFAVHVTADRRRLLVTHGDQFDLVVRHSRVVSMLGAQAYDLLVMANRRYNALRRRLGLPYQSLSKAVKSKVKTACMFVSRFEEALMHEAERRGLDGVVCGHIHQAEVRTDGPVAYYNCGDWVEGCTAIVEHHDGRMELIDAEQVLGAAKPAARPKTRKAVRAARAADPEMPALADLIRFSPEAMENHDSDILTFGEDELDASPALAPADHGRNRVGPLA
ncbi:MAG: UDP-2,3-diacylglucosamine diphosphatase [Planctomycetota bacterium]